MFAPSVGVGELLLRVAIVYVAIFVLLRVVGKKHVGALTPFDLVVLLLLSESVQNALIADDSHRWHFGRRHSVRFKPADWLRFLAQQKG